MIVLGGRGGSGKSFFTTKGAGPIDESKFIVIDSDKFKSQLPEYKGWNAALLHDECDTLVELAQQRAQKYGLNVLHDATIKNEEGVAMRVADYKGKGYRIEGHYMFCPPEEAAKRATGRFVSGGQKAAAAGKQGELGRFVPPEVVLGNRANERNFDKLTKAFDDWSVYDNSVMGGAPKFVANKKGDKVAPGTSPQAAGQTGSTGKPASQTGSQGKAADRRYAIGDWIIRITSTTGRGGHGQRLSR
jgi:predicted ABC-type ATPase